MSQAKIYFVNNEKCKCGRINQVVEIKKNGTYLRGTDAGLVYCDNTWYMSALLVLSYNQTDG